MMSLGATVTLPTLARVRNRADFVFYFLEEVGNSALLAQVL